MRGKTGQPHFPQKPENGTTYVFACGSTVAGIPQNELSALFIEQVCLSAYFNGLEHRMTLRTDQLAIER